MSFDDDDLEERLRTALQTSSTGDRLDADAFLAQVRHGARLRRIRRGAAVTTAAVLLVSGGGFALDASGVLARSETPLAASPRQPTSPASAPSHPSSSTDPQSSADTQSKVVPPTKPSESRASTASPSAQGSVRIRPHQPISAGNVTPVSLSATGDEHQWVLGKTPGGHDCAYSSCATVFSTDQHGTTWADLGQLPAAPATTVDPTTTSVSQLRFTKRADGTYDGWAFGNALWSTHDSGQSWSADSAPPGQVTQLEAWGGYVYAGVSSAVPGADTATLYRSSTEKDDWQPVPVGTGLTSVQSLSAAQGVLGLVDSGGPRSTLYVSKDGISWERQDPCPTGFDPGTLSTATDTATGTGSLWVTCDGASSTLIRFMDTTSFGTWQAPTGTGFGGTISLAARTPTSAMVAGAGVSGILQVSATLPPFQVYPQSVGTPLYFGFTNDHYGYLLNTDGAIVSTTDGGKTWAPYAVSDTKP